MNDNKPPQFPLSKDNIRRELVMRMMRYVLDAGSFDEASFDLALNRATAELEREILTHYATAENMLRKLDGELPH